MRRTMLILELCCCLLLRKSQLAGPHTLFFLLQRLDWYLFLLLLCLFWILLTSKWCWCFHNLNIFSDFFWLVIRRNCYFFVFAVALCSGVSFCVENVNKIDCAQRFAVSLHLFGRVCVYVHIWTRVSVRFAFLISFYTPFRARWLQLMLLLSFELFTYLLFYKASTSTIHGITL